MPNNNSKSLQEWIGEYKTLRDRVEKVASNLEASGVHRRMAKKHLVYIDSMLSTMQKALPESA